MPLTLTIRSDESGAAVPPPLRLQGRGATIGRAPGCDWTLPDERATVSSRHCQIAFQDGVYLLADTSTNGTAVNGRRIAAPQRLNDGDRIGIGPYDIAVAVSAEPAAAMPAASSTAVGAAALLQAACVRRADLAAEDAAILATAGRLLRELTAGTAMLLEHAARARAELSKQRPSDGRTGLPLPALLADVEAGGRVAAAFDEIDRHQLATLKAMQAGLKATLDALSPAAIRSAAGARADAAALWQAYEQAFAAQDGGFVDRFAREFATAYEALTRQPPQR